MERLTPTRGIYLFFIRLFFLALVWPGIEEYLDTHLKIEAIIIIRKRGPCVKFGLLSLAF